MYIVHQQGFASAEQSLSFSYNHQSFVNKQLDPSSCWEAGSTLTVEEGDWHGFAPATISFIKLKKEKKANICAEQDSSRQETIMKQPPPSKAPHCELNQTVAVQYMAQTVSIHFAKARLPGN